MCYFFSTFLLINSLSHLIPPYRAFSFTWPAAHADLLEQKNVFTLEKSTTPTGLVWYSNMAAVSLFWYTNIAAVTSCENAQTSAFDDLDLRCHPPLQKNLRGMPDTRPKIHPSPAVNVTHTISTPNPIRIAFFLRRTQKYPRSG